MNITSSLSSSSLSSLAISQFKCMNNSSKDQSDEFKRKQLMDAFCPPDEEAEEEEGNHEDIQIIDKPNENYSENNFWFIEDIKGLIEDQDEEVNGKGENEDEDQDECSMQYAFVSKPSGETTYTNHTHESSVPFGFDDDCDSSFIIKDKEEVNDQCLNKDQDQCQEQETIIFNHISTEELLFTIVSQATKQSSCRDLQEKLNSNPQLVTIYFNALITSKDSLMELITHPFGNYFIQSLTRIITEDQRKTFLLAIEPLFLDISVNFYGTRVIQNFIASIQSSSLLQLLTQISLNILDKIVTTINGTHIIFTLLTLNNQSIKQLIFTQLNSKLIDIAIDKHGSCFIQKMIQLEPIMSNEIINTLIANSLLLLTDQYGHYTIKYIISLNNPFFNMKVIQVIMPQFLHLANQRFSSTVLEYCFESLDYNSKRYLYSLIMNYGVMRELLVNQFGNYVLQKAIDYADVEMKKYLLMVLAPNMFALKRDAFGKQLFSKICVKYPVVKDMVNVMKGKKKANWA